MQKWLEDNDLSIYSTYNEGKSVIAESIKRLVDEYNNTCPHVIDEKPLHADYSALNEKIESSDKAPKFKVGVRVTITKHKNIFSKGYTKTLVVRYICD